MTPGSSLGPGGNLDIDRIISGLQQEGQEIQNKSRKYVELGQAQETVRQNITTASAVVNGQIQKVDAGGQLKLGGEDKSTSIAVQSVLGGLAAAINLAWITYFGTDMPAELYAAVPVFIQLIAQGVATAYNNRK